MAKLESQFQKDLKDEIAELFPGCFIFKQDEQQTPGIPDLLILFNDRWAMLVVKRDESEMNHPRPNQPYYVELFNELSFAAFIYPGNREEVLDDLQRSLASRR